LLDAVGSKQIFGRLRSTRLSTNRSSAGSSIENPPPPIATM
jgi:hypothetical protein